MAPNADATAGASQGWHDLEAVLAKEPAATLLAAYLAQQVVLEELVLAERHARERLKRIETAVAELLPSWSLAPVVEALQALRGIGVVTAATIMVEAGDLSRFESARQSRPGARRALDRQHRAPARHHQGRQWQAAAGSGRECLDL